MKRMELEAHARATRVASVAALLSLDCLRPLLGDLGLGGGNGDSLRQAVRDAIRAFRARAAESDVPPLDFEDELLTTVAQRVGDAEAQALRRFIDERFHESFGDLPHWCGWQLAFQHAAYEPGQHDALELPLDRRNAALEDVQEMLDVGEIEAQLRSLLGQRVTDWDVGTFVRRGWDPNDEAGAPFGLTIDLVRMCRFQVFARALTARMNDAELDRTRAAAERLLARHGIALGEALAGLPRLLGIPSQTKESTP